MQNRANGGQTRKKCIIWINKYRNQKSGTVENAVLLFLGAVFSENFLKHIRQEFECKDDDYIRKSSKL